ncbi:MAG: hypothetical protein WDA09_00895 [Bacteriovoracaceae bacterium]
MENLAHHIAISHEVPALLMEESRVFNDFDYALVHLFETRPAYYDFFVESLSRGRAVVLDNSVFELGTPFDPDRYLYWIEKLRPTYAIIPDKFGDADFTIEEVEKWVPKLKTLGVKSMGAIQGSTMDELVRCYDAIADQVDRIAISFAQPAYAKAFPLLSTDQARIYGRHLLINTLEHYGTIRKSKPHHLLGLSLPQEMKLYRQSGFSFITSVDSSSPIVHGLHSIEYTNDGLEEKLKIKLADLFDCPMSLINDSMDCILHNINVFRNFTR